MDIVGDGHWMIGPVQPVEKGVYVFGGAEASPPDSAHFRRCLCANVHVSGGRIGRY
jgi:hypothetical protein